MISFLLRQAALWLALLAGFGHDIEGARNLAVALTIVYFAAVFVSIDDLNVAAMAKRGPSAVPAGLGIALDMAAAAVFVWNAYWITALLMACAGAIMSELQAKLAKLREARP